MNSINELSEQENLTVTAFRESLSQLNIQDNLYAEHYLKEDFTLWRYVLAKSNEENPLDASKDMYVNSVKWKKDLSLAALCEEFSLSRPISQRSIRSKFGHLCFHGGMLPIKTIRNGPVLFERFGKIDLPGLAEDECKLLLM